MKFKAWSNGLRQSQKLTLAPSTLLMPIGSYGPVIGCGGGAYFH